MSMCVRACAYCICTLPGILFVYDILSTTTHVCWATPSYISHAHRARASCARGIRTYDGVLSVASKRQPSIQSSPFYIRQWGNPITVQRSLHGMGNMTPRIIWNLYAWKYIPIYNQHKIYKFSFLPRTIIDGNTLSPHSVDSPSIDTFRARITNK